MKPDTADDAVATNYVNNVVDETIPVVDNASLKDLPENGVTPCFLCERQDESAKCPPSVECGEPSTGENRINGGGDDDLETLRAFDLKVRLTSHLCQCCWTHLRLLASVKRSDTVDRNSTDSFCHADCPWTSMIACLPLIEAEPESPPDNPATFQRTFDRVKIRLHNQALVELTSKTLPENLQLPPIKSYDELSSFFKSRITLSPNIALVDRKSPATSTPKKRGRPRLSDAKPKSPKPNHVHCSTPVDRVSRETTRLRELDCSYLEIVFRHPEGYSPHSILIPPERLLDRSSVRKSVSFSEQNTFIERLAYEGDSDGSDDSDTSCSRSPGMPVSRCGSPVPKRRKIEQEAHPNKLSPAKSPQASPSKPSSKVPAVPPANQNGSKKHVKVTTKVKDPSMKAKKAPNGVTDKSKSNVIKTKPVKSASRSPKSKSDLSTPKKTKVGKSKSKTGSPSDDVFRLKISSLIHAKRKPAPKRSPAKRLQPTYLQKKFGRRMFSCRVNVMRIVNGVLDEVNAGSHNQPDDVEMKRSNYKDDVGQNGEAAAAAVRVILAEADSTSTKAVTARQGSPVELNDPLMNGARPTPEVKLNGTL